MINFYKCQMRLNPSKEYTNIINRMFTSEFDKWYEKRVIYTLIDSTRATAFGVYSKKANDYRIDYTQRKVGEIFLRARQNLSYLSVECCARIRGNEREDFFIIAIDDSTGYTPYNEIAPMILHDAIIETKKDSFNFLRKKCGLTISRGIFQEKNNFENGDFFTFLQNNKIQPHKIIIG